MNRPNCVYIPNAVRHRSIFYRHSGMKRLILCLLVSLLASSCSLMGEKPRVYYQSSTAVSLADSLRVKKALQTHYSRWQGTPYRPGGMGLTGVDCSGFTLLTYHQLFGLNLGRSTEDQLEQGMPVDRETLRPGDLIFFKTGFFKKHVGIYLDQGLFVHASATKGVTISTLRLNYWHKTFWTARRYGV